LNGRKYENKLKPEENGNYFRFFYKKDSDGDFQEHPVLKKAPRKDWKQAQLSAVSLPGETQAFFYFSQKFCTKKRRNFLKTKEKPGNALRAPLLSGVAFFFSVSNAVFFISGIKRFS